MIPAIRFPKTVVELNAIPALTIMPRKLRICPLSDLSIGRVKMKIMIPVRIKKNDMAPLAMLPFDLGDLNFLKIHVFIINRIMKTRITKVG
jgi:hypothetical protein